MDKTMPGGTDPFTEGDWRQIELGLARILRDVIGGMPRDGNGKPAWIETRKRLVIAPNASYGQDVAYIDARGHVDELVALARCSSAYEVLASRLPLLTNHLAGRWQDDLERAVELALQRKSGGFERDFLAPLLVRGVEAVVAGGQPEEEAVDMINRLKALVEPNVPRWRFWWLLSNTSAPPAPQDVVHDVRLADDVRLVSLPFHERGDFHSELSEDGFGPTIGELRHCGWRLEVTLPQGADPRFPDVPADSQVQKAHQIRDQILVAVALAVGGNALTCWWGWTPEFWAPDSMRNGADPPCQPARPHQHYFAGEIAEIDAPTMADLAGMWSRVRDAWDDDDLRIAMGRFKRAVRQPNEIDSIRDQFSGLERLLLEHKESPKGPKIRSRTVKLLSELGEESTDTDEFLKEVYDARNADLHDAIPPVDIDVSRLTHITRVVLSYAIDAAPWAEERVRLAERAAGDTEGNRT